MLTANKLPFVLSRGGTSRCCLLRHEDLPLDPNERDQVLLRVIGGPDAKQLDGLGGGTQSTSKVLIVRRPEDAGAFDIQYTFAQIVVGKPRVDYGGNCGNCLSAAAAYAVDSGWVEACAPSTTVRIWNTNTEQAFAAEVPVENGHAAVQGDLAIDGVPGTGAPIRLWFLEPAGAVTGSLLPTGNVLDLLDLTGSDGLDSVRVTIVDAGNLVVFVRAADVGASGDETAAEIDADPKLLARLEAVRAATAVRLRLVANAVDAAALSPSIPKVAMLSPHEPTNGGRDVTARIMAGGKAHPSYAITGGIATAIAAQTSGSVCDLSGTDAADSSLTIHHPAGSLRFEVDAKPDGSVSRVAVLRTSRRIAEGVLTLQ